MGNLPVVGARRRRVFFCELRSVARSTKALMPGFIKPQLATRKDKAPSGAQRIHEIKFDGYRVKSTSIEAPRKFSPAMATTGPIGALILPAPSE